MKVYEKPYLEITSYEAEDVITLSAQTVTGGEIQGYGIQKTFKEISF